jgi:hypothetical protein
MYNQLLTLYRTTINIQPQTLAPFSTTQRANKSVDYILGLKLSDDEMRELNHKSAFVAEGFQSVNQSLHKLVNNCPNFLDIEVKMLDSRDAKVQLGIWAAAGYKKKVLHGWSTDLPMLALGIQKHEWRLHVGFCIQSELVSIMSNPISHSF